MRQTPCEHLIWNGLPVIRREIAKSMVKDYHLNQKQTAEKLGITPAAVSQYLSGKRANTVIKDKDILKEIKKSAKAIIDNDQTDIIKETCRLCVLMRKRSFFTVSCDFCLDSKETKEENEE